jgi:16S rRNA (cytosine1402-N4)-methyltransferase
MSYGTTSRSGFSAAEALNEWSEQTLADAIFGYGEERYARRIAKAIVTRRETKKFETTMELVEVVRDAVPAAYRRGRINPATKTFQALRIAVNDELGALREGLSAAWDALAPGGRIAVISFHSIEDRIVKRYFAELVKKEEGKLLYKKPLAPTMAEIKRNPASRSAKLRVIENICTR